MVLADGTPMAGEAVFGRDTLLLLALDAECPLCRACAPGLAELPVRPTFRVVGLHASPHALPDSVRAFAEGARLLFPQVMDPQCAIAGSLGVRVTPEVFLIAPDGAVLYRGAIDDRAVRAGRMRPAPVHNHLRNALSSLAAGGLPAQREVPAVGCLLECTGTRTP